MRRVRRRDQRPARFERREEAARFRPVRRSNCSGQAAGGERRRVHICAISPHMHKSQEAAEYHITSTYTK